MINQVLIDVMWLLTIDLAALGAGSVIIRLFRKKRDLRKIDYLNATVTGFGLLGFVLFMLGVLKLLYVPLLVFLTVSAALKGAVEVFRFFRTLTLSEFKPDFRIVVTLIIVLFFIFSFWKGLAPVLHHDTEAYHLNIPLLYLQNNGIVPMEYDLFGNMPHSVEVLYTLFLAVAGYGSIKFFVLQCGVFIVLGLYYLGKKLWSGTEYILPLIFISSKNVMVMISTCYIELILAAFFLYAVINLLEYAEGRSRSALISLGVIAGFIIGAKYTVWIFITGILLALLLVFRKLGRGEAMKAFVVFSLIILLFIVPWLIKNSVYTGNPVFPNAYSVFGGKWWSDVQGMQLYRDAMTLANGEGKHGLSSLLAPVNLVTQPELYFTAGTSPVLLLLFLMSLFLIKGSNDSEKLLLIAAHIPFWLWCFLPFMTRARFILTILPLMILVAGITLKRIVNNRKWLNYSVTLLVLLLLFMNYNYKMLSTEIFRKDFYEKVKKGQYSNQLMRLVEAFTDKNDKVFFFFENRTCFVKRDKFHDSVYGAPASMEILRECKNAEAFAGKLSNMGVTHIVVNKLYAGAYLNNSFKFQVTDPKIYPVKEHVDLKRQFSSFLNRFTTRLYQNKLISVYKLK